MRSAKTWPASDAAPGHYTLVGTTEVKDNRTGLIWSRAEEASEYRWTEAKTACADKGSGYRLPTIRELQSLLDETAKNETKVDATFFTGTPNATVWSSTPDTLPGRAMYVFFWGGQMADGDTTTALKVRCVR